MLDQLIPDTILLLIAALFVAFVWWIARLYEITYEGNVERLPRWMQAWGKTLVVAQEPPGKAWRWVLIGLFIVYYAFYLVTFDGTPLLVRLVATIFGLTVFGMCIYYCEKKMGK
jgi:hypothetical protein